MKRLRLNSIYVAMACCCSSCLFRNDGNTSISISETKSSFTMSAHYDERKTRSVEEFIDKQLGNSTAIALDSKTTDSTFTLQDKTTFYLRSAPGELKIKLNKAENSFASYTAIKEMCEGVKEVIATDGN